MDRSRLPGFRRRRGSRRIGQARQYGRLRLAATRQARSASRPLLPSRRSPRRSRAATEVETPSHMATADRCSPSTPAGDDSRCGGVLVARCVRVPRSVMSTMPSRCASSRSGSARRLTACGAVVVDVRARCRSRRRGLALRSLGCSRGWRLGATARQDGAAALAEPVCGHDGRTASHARHLLAAHSLVLGRIAFAFSTNSMRSHTSVVSCASAR